MLKSSSKTDHLLQSVRLNALQSRLVPGLLQRETPFEMRLVDSRDKRITGRIRRAARQGMSHLEAYDLGRSGTGNFLLVEAQANVKATNRYGVTPLTRPCGTVSA